VDIQRAFKAPFADQKWFVKSLWAGLWAGLGVTAPAVAGYTLDYVRNIAYGYETPLPEWNREFGRWWVRGFLVTIAAMIYMLPAFLLLAIGFVPMIGAVAASEGYGSDVGGAMAMLGGGALCLTSFVAVVYVIGVSVFFYAAYVNYALSEDFGSMFRVKEIMARLRTDGAGYFSAWGMSIVISIGAGTVGGMIGSILGATVVLAPLAGFVGGAVGFLAGLMTAHLFGQYAAKAYALPGLPPAPVAPVGYTAAAYPAPPAPGAPYAPPAPAQYPQTAPPAPPASPAPSVAPTVPAAAPPLAPIAPMPEPATDDRPTSASSAHSEPDSPVPSYSPEQAAPPSGPDSDPPAEDGGA
jgi:hypothetical protein